MRFLLIVPYDFESIGARSLSASLTQNEVEHHVHYFQPLRFNAVQRPDDDDWEALLEQVSRYAPDVVGLSVRSPYVAVARRIGEEVRERFDVPIIWGGAHSSMLPYESLADADFVCLGEGEQALAHFLRGFPGSATQPPAGILSRGSSEPPKIQWIPDLDELPDARFTNEHVSYQTGNDVRPGDPLLEQSAFAHYGEPELHELMASRGCPFTCSYCCAPKISSPRVRTRSVDRVIDEIQAIRRLKDIERVTFLDEVFGLRIGWLRELATAYASRVGLPFSAELHPTLVTEERVTLMAQAGMGGVEIGIQSGAERIRREVYRRPVSNDQIRDALDRLIDARIAVSLDLILDNPYEDERDMRGTFELLLTLPRPFALKTFSLTYLPGTALTERMLEERRIEPGDVEHEAQKSLLNWRARASGERSGWRQYWTTMILLAGARRPGSTRDGWLTTPTRIEHLQNAFTVEELRAIAADSSYRANPEALRALYLAHVPEAARGQIA